MTTPKPQHLSPDDDAGNIDLSAALAAAMNDVEEHVAEGGWDQQRQLFALVPTEELLAHEPALIGQLGPRDDSNEDFAAGALPLFTPVEQENLPGKTLAETLAKVAWPDTISGAILVLEIVAETEEQHAEGRLAVGVLRDFAGGQCLLRWRHDPTGPLVHSNDLAPDLLQALQATFAP